MTINLLRKAINEIVDDQIQLLHDANASVEKLEVDALMATLKNNNVLPELQDLMQHAQGDLSEHSYTFSVAKYVDHIDNDTPMKMLTQFMPVEVSPKTLMPFTHLEVYSDSILVGSKTKLTKKYEWEHPIEVAFPQTLINKHYHVEGGAVLVNLAAQVEARQAAWKDLFPECYRDGTGRKGLHYILECE